jgi:hypothetical protein
MRALNQPVSWWGWHWEPPTPMSIIEIIRAGNMPPKLAAMLWIGLERGASIIVAADPPNSGKTTTLSALLSFTPPDTAVYFTRGQGETFSLPPVSPSYPTYILINEMSDHIPVYTWDDNARRAFDLLAQGYSIATTMHDETVEGVIRQLRGDLHIPPTQIANVTFIMPLYVGRLGGAMRRVLEVALLQADGEDLRTTTLASWHIESDTFDILSTQAQREAFASWAKLSPDELTTEIDRREGFLTTLLDTGINPIPEVNAAIQGYYEQLVEKKAGM